MQILLFCLICCPGQALVSGPALGEREGALATKRLLQKHLGAALRTKS